MVIPPANTFENIDCMEMLTKCPDKHFDLAIVDPPYGLNIGKRNGSIGQKKGQGIITRYKWKDWDASPPSSKYFNELFRASKNQIIFGANYFTKELPASKCWLVYDKKQPEGVTFAMAELAYTSFDVSTKVIRGKRSEMQNCVSNNNVVGRTNAKIHPAQKPIFLYRWILQKFAKPTDLILDTHVGSGSSIVACIEGGFNYYGCEIDKDYYEAAQKRIARAFRKYEMEFKNDG
jgi:site-specific DNA-methyltransferase (adenine-specific)